MQLLLADGRPAAAPLPYSRTSVSLLPDGDSELPSRAPPSTARRTPSASHAPGPFAVVVLLDDDEAGGGALAPRLSSGRAAQGAGGSRRRTGREQQRAPPVPPPADVIVLD